VRELLERRIDPYMLAATLADRTRYERGDRGT
jgi:hypothetical protein